jgi:DNA-cytosine methyltransferase
MNVLSLFDGISCGRVALERANINVIKYYASEIDKYAIQVSQNNYPDIIRLGDINNWENWDIDWSSIDLILAGSPCQGFSFAGKQLAFDDKRSALFFRFAEILSHVQSLNQNVKFLLENVRMKKEFEHVITSVVGVEPVLINSALVSAQNRKRLYWANWAFEQPEDKLILLKDIIDYTALTDKSRAIFQRPRGKNEGSILTEKSSSMTSRSWEHNNVICSAGWIKWWNENKEHQQQKKYSQLCNDEPKSITLTARQYASWNGNFYQIDDKTFRKLTPVECERLQTLPDNYTAGISNSQRYKCLGNGWTVDVIAHILRAINY